LHYSTRGFFQNKENQNIRLSFYVSLRRTLS
jgi:hypothetical protein